MEIGVLVSFCLGWNARGVRRPMRLRSSGSFGGGRRHRPPRARREGRGDSGLGGVAAGILLDLVCLLFYYVSSRLY